MRHLLLTIAMICAYASASAQEAFVEASGTVSSGSHSPLWLSSNKHGTVSPYANSSYERIGYKHEFDFGKTISENRCYCPDEEETEESDWHLTAVADFMLSQKAQQTFCIHQLYGELSYKKISLTVGQKEREIDMRNNRLTSGGLSLGINAQPMPEALLNVDYFSIPFTDHWWKWRFRVGYGKSMDGNWQKKWIADPDKDRYNSNCLFNEKALGWKFGDEERFPLTFEPSIQMFTQFGGTTYNAVTETGIMDIPHSENFSAFWHAFWPMGSEGETDGLVKNAAGNTVGSYNIALTWTAEDWKVRSYFERVFEDQSMLTVQYGIFDHLVGVEVELPENSYVSHVVIEHMSTKDQAGPLFHDKTENIPESYTGIDDYYNHSLYSGWQNYGMAIGNPLITSPIYNSDHKFRFYNNRIRALHIALDGNPASWLSWRLFATLTRNWGTYNEPLDDVRNQQYFMAEATIRPEQLKGWMATVSLGYDHGDLDMLGNSFGAQLTIRKTFSFRKKRW